MNEHPSPDVLQQLIDGQLDAVDQTEIERHVETGASKGDADHFNG